MTVLAFTDVQCSPDDYGCLVCRNTIVAWPGTRANSRQDGEEAGLLHQVDRALNPTVRSYVKERTARNYLREHMRNVSSDSNGGLLSMEEAICAATSGAEILVENDLAADTADKELLAAVAHSVRRSLECLEVHIGRTTEEDALHRLLETHSQVSEKLAAYRRLTEDRRAEATAQSSASAVNRPVAPPSLAQEATEGTSPGDTVGDVLGGEVNGFQDEAEQEEQTVQGARSCLLPSELRTVPPSSSGALGKDDSSS